MSYLDAPATKLLATHCACCGRALVDAVSVEAGVGPDCRKKYGYAEAQAEPAWREVLRETDGLVALAEIVGLGPGAGDFAVDAAAVGTLWGLGGVETRRVANVLVHRIALALSRAAVEAPVREGEPVLHLIRAVRAVGFHRLADRIAERVVAVRIELDCGEYVVRTPYSEAGARELGALPRTTRRWSREERAWRVQVDARPLLFSALRRGYPGAFGVGPRGMFQL